MSKIRVPKKTGEGRDFIPEPISDEESHVAVCTGVFYLGTQRGDYNGKEYEKLHGGLIHLPNNHQYRPGPEFLEWHNENVFRG